MAAACSAIPTRNSSASLTPSSAPYRPAKWFTPFSTITPPTSVTRYLLDTNIISEALKPCPSGLIAEWLQSQVDSDLFVATLTIAEIWRGVLTTLAGHRRRELETWFASPQGPQSLFRGRVLSLDERA